MNQDDMRHSLIEIFKKYPERSFDGWELFRKLGLPYSSVLYFKMVNILKDLAMEGSIQQKAGMWEVCWKMEEEDIVIKRCLECGFEQREKKNRISKCKNCGSSNMWGELDVKNKEKKRYRGSV